MEWRGQGYQQSSSSWQVVVQQESQKPSPFVHSLFQCFVQFILVPSNAFTVIYIHFMLFYLSNSPYSFACLYSQFTAEWLVAYILGSMQEWLVAYILCSMQEWLVAYIIGSMQEWLIAYILGRSGSFPIYM